MIIVIFLMKLFVDICDYDDCDGVELDLMFLEFFVFENCELFKMFCMVFVVL